MTWYQIQLFCRNPFALLLLFLFALEHPVELENDSPPIKGGSDGCFTRIFELRERGSAEVWRDALSLKEEVLVSCTSGQGYTRVVIQRSEGVAREGDLK